MGTFEAPGTFSSQSGVSGAILEHWPILLGFLSPHLLGGELGWGGWSLCAFPLQVDSLCHTGAEKLT